MVNVHYFTFNEFQENTYIVSDETKECVIFDPGCNTDEERRQVTEYIAANALKPVRLINTHCHIDHVLGNPFIARKYGLALEAHRGELPVLHAGPALAGLWGIFMEPAIEPSVFIEDGDLVAFGNTTFKAILAPGHSPASLCFYDEKDQVLIAGDVLFHESIGNASLPGADLPTLLKSIRNRLFVLEDETVVYPGHGGPTTIGHEKQNNPFVGLNKNLR